MEKIVLQAVRREVIGKQVRALRRDGKLPAVIYGRHIQPIPIVLDFREVTRSLSGVGASTLLEVQVDGQPFQTLVREKQRHPVIGGLIHIDFLAVSMDEKLRTTVAVELVGKSPAVEMFNAILVDGANELEIECLPQDLLDVIRVDVTGLKEIGDVIYVSDLKVGEGIEILSDPEMMIATVTAPEAEEVVEVAAAAEEPEMIERGKKEEEE
ncbi:MAG: 50S ribosomal protein L25 [Anaerolineales bacterium]|nr:50S ribosomal protein L25 [Anaerolineales bacterium]